MSVIDNAEIDQLNGVEPEKKTLSTPLLTNDQKSNMLNPPTPFYAKSKGQIFLVACVVVPVGMLLYSLFSGGGEDNTKTAKVGTSDNEKLLVKQLEDERLARQASDKAAAFSGQNAMTAVPVVKPGVKVPGKPKAPAPQNISTVPIVTRSYGPPAPQRVFSDPPAIIPLRRSYVPPSYNPVAFRPSVASTGSIPREDPEQAWKRLSELGSYGGSSSSSIASSGNPYTPAVYTPPYTPPYNNSVIEADYTPSSETEPSTASYTPPTGVSVAAGTEAKGELSTPVLWAQDINISEDEFLVKLTKPLGTALPKGALVIVKPDKLSSAGLIRFKAVRATVNGEDKTLPDGIQVVSSEGGFIKAEQKRPGAGFNFSDVFSVFLGGAKTATALINQPTTSSSFSSTGGSIQTVTNSQPNILAAFGQGAADSMLSRAQSRVQQVQTNRSPYFLIGSGTEVKLIVTQTISM